MAEAGTAIRIRQITGWRGDAWLYKVDPPIVEHGWGSDQETKHDFVIVSAADVMFSGPETYIFPATADGEVVNWGELEGSFKGSLDHEAALRGAGYVVGEVLVVEESEQRTAVTG